MERHFYEQHLASVPYIQQAGEVVAHRLKAQADQGDPEAQDQLGEWYQWSPSVSGGGSSECYRWYKRAANQGHVAARQRLDEFFGYPAFERTWSDQDDDPTSDDLGLLQEVFREHLQEYGLSAPENLDLFSPASDAVFDELTVKRDEERRNGQIHTMTVDRIMPKASKKERRLEVLESRVSR